MTVKVISDEYMALNRELHEAAIDFGTSGGQEAKLAVAFANELKAKTILDYGCGKGRFKSAVSSIAPQLKVYEYDPAIPGKERCRNRADLVVCGDVMEHIEPTLLDNVLTHILSIMEKGGLFVITHKEASRTLPDGRNAHLIQEPPEWWRKRLEEHFPFVREQTIGLMAGTNQRVKTTYLVKPKYSLDVQR